MELFENQFFMSPLSLVDWRILGKVNFKHMESLHKHIDDLNSVLQH